MKQCTCCKELKPFEAFRPNPKMRDGINSWCRKCCNRSAELSRKKNPDACKALYRQKYASKMQRLHGNDYVVGSESNIKRRGGRRAVLTPEEVRLRHNVRRVTRRAVAAGKITKMPCQVCGHALSEAHHVDYSKPLEILWLCPTHHREIHLTKE